MRLEWADEALADLGDIGAYLAEFDRSLPDRMVVRTQQAILPLLDNPRLGPVVNGYGLRKWRVPRTPYRIFYDVRGELIRVLRVVRAASDWTNYV